MEFNIIPNDIEFLMEMHFKKEVLQDDSSLQRCERTRQDFDYD